MRLQQSFFEQPTLVVARELLGKRLVFQSYQGIITETEAYIGEEDPACHASKGKTKRTWPLYGPAGRTYVYFIYGMYYCLNIVTETIDFPAAVLIRGLHIMTPSPEHLNGPGKICRKLGLTCGDTNRDLLCEENFYITSGNCIKNITQTPRIGIRQGLDKPWRFLGEYCED